MYLATLSPAPWEEITLAVAERFGDPRTDQLARRIAEDADAGPANAPVVLRNVGSGPLESALTPLFGTGAAEAKRLAEAREEFLGHKGALKELRRDVWHARRALANVPTYMLADDHDVTDDWFLNGKVERQLRGTGVIPGPGGRRMMRNALAAYAVFQHWGNDPVRSRQVTA